MFESVNVIGRGRVGSAVAARLEQRGVELREDAELQLLCVPDTAIADIARDLVPGQWVAHVSGETDEARAHGRALALTLGLRPFDLDDDERSLYHAGAAIASNYLVTLHRAASRLFDAAGAPPEALVPLMTRTIENGFDLTGPIARGDWDTVDKHVRAIHDEAPDLEPMYVALAEATRV